MAKFIVSWNVGYGDISEVVECENFEKAQRYAYEAWREESESQADYGVEEYTEEKAEELGLD